MGFLRIKKYQEKGAGLKKRKKIHRDILKGRGTEIKKTVNSDFQIFKIKRFKCP